MKVVNYNIKMDVDFENKKYTGFEHIKIEDSEKELKFDLNEIKYNFIAEILRIDIQMVKLYEP